MTDRRIHEAVWTLDDGPLDSEATAGRLFVAVGQLKHIDPVRYELNRRGRWRDYDGRRLMVDLLTQRTQLVTIAEKRDADQGGAKVVIGTGKQQKPPQAVCRWRGAWPPPKPRVDEWADAVRDAFSELPMARFALRVADDPDGDPSQGSVWIGALSSGEADRDVAELAENRGRRLTISGGEGRVFEPGGEMPPKRWNRWWNEG